MLKKIKLFFLLLCFYCLNINAQDCPQPTDSMFMPYYTKKALRKVDDLGFMLTIISDKKTDPIDANTAIDNAVNLFISDSATVQVTNIRDTSYRHIFFIREYLRRLKALKYDKVEISWTSIQYVSDLRLGDDNNYHGVVSYEQKFSGIIDGKTVYEDMTKKNTLVVVKANVVEDSGKSFICWEVFLSDIEVVQTARK